MREFLETLLASSWIQSRCKASSDAHKELKEEVFRCGQVGTKIFDGSGAVLSE
jgi:hypothetical protein